MTLIFSDVPAELKNVAVIKKHKKPILRAFLSAEAETPFVQDDPPPSSSHTHAHAATTPSSPPPSASTAATASTAPYVPFTEAQQT